MFLFLWLSFYLLPVGMGLIGSRYMGLVPNFLMMWAAFVAYGSTANFAIFGKFDPIQMVVLQFASPGAVLPLLIFLLVAKVAERRKKERTGRYQPT